MTASLIAAAAGVLVLVMILWLRRRYLVVTVNGQSMEPTLRPGQQVLIQRIDRTLIRPGHIVVLDQYPIQITSMQGEAGRVVETGDIQGSTRWIKRVIAVPGDPIPRDRIPALRDANGNAVPPGCLVVVGDNGSQSIDSRQYGYAPLDKLVGVAVRGLGSGSDFRIRK